MNFKLLPPKACSLWFLSPVLFLQQVYTECRLCQVLLWGGEGGARWTHLTQRMYISVGEFTSWRRKWMKNPPLSYSYLLSYAPWAQMGSGPCSLEYQFWSKDLPTHSRPLMWHKAQLKTQKFQLLLPSKQFYMWLPIHSQTSLQSWAELTKGNWKLIVFQFYFF